MSNPSDVAARMASRCASYAVQVVVNLAPIALLVSPPAFFIDDSFDKAEVERFLFEHRRIHAASNAIANAILYAWRMPTEDEIRRLDELVVEHQVAIATLERSRVTPH